MEIGDCQAVLLFCAYLLSYLYSAQQWPLQPRFFSLSFSARAINFSLSISFDGLDLEITVAVSTDGSIQKLSIFPCQNVLFAENDLWRSVMNAFWCSWRKDWCLVLLSHSLVFLFSVCIISSLFPIMFVKSNQPFMTVPQNVVDHVRDLGASSVEQVHSSWHSAAQHLAVLIWYCKQHSCACLPFSKLSLQAQLPVMEALVPWFLPHTLTQWGYALYVHQFRCPELSFCLAAYFRTFCILSAGMKEKEDTRPMHFAICLFPSWAAPLQRKCSFFKVTG